MAPGKLLPSTPEAMANANRWMDWQLSTFNPVIVPLFFATIRTAPEKRDPQAIQAALEKTAKAWQIVEDQLAKAIFLVVKNSRLVIFRWAYGPIAGSICPSSGRHSAIYRIGTNDSNSAVPIRLTS
jgi:glutathione S-transferase